MNEWQDPLVPQPEPELFPGSLIGYRQFLPEISLNEGRAPFVRSLYADTFFEDEEWHYASCSLVTTRHEAPDENCRCGYYINYLPDVTYTRFLTHQVRAVVECAGRICLATKGYRAARMRILGLAVPSHLVKDFERRFSHVTALEDWKHLVEEFPQSDYDSLLGRPVRELASAPTKSKTQMIQVAQAAENLRKSFAKMTVTFDGESFKKLAAMIDTLNVPAIMPPQQNPALGKSAFLRLADYAKQDTEATGTIQGKSLGPAIQDEFRVWVGDGNGGLRELKGVSNLTINFRKPPSDRQE